MSKWTKWRKIADEDHWYNDNFDYEGPACYELGLGGPRGGNIRPVYVGETTNEQKRMISYAQHGSHITEIVSESLENGWFLYYRAQALSSKKAAQKMQNSLLNRFEYEWNKNLNRRK